MDAGARVWGEYGTGLIARLGNDLTPQFGRGFSRQNLQNMRLLYLDYPLDKIRQTVSGKSDDNSIEAQLGELFDAFPLPWPACVRLQSVKNVQAREFYETEALRGGWSVRQLSRQTDSRLTSAPRYPGTRRPYWRRGRAPFRRSHASSGDDQREVTLTVEAPATLTTPTAEDPKE